MELSDFARCVLSSEQLDRKLAVPGETFSDGLEHEAERVIRPARPEQLQFAAQRTAPKMPKAAALKDPRKRAIAHHIMANHELQALEVMAMVILAFPQAPVGFRRGVGEIMLDEQRHTRLHVQRAAELGIRFGELPVNGYIWTRAVGYASVLEYVCGLPLVFEGGNLDHTAEFEEYFLDAGDRRSAGIMRSIHRDEIRHVEFGLKWLRRLKPPGMDDFTVWEQNLTWPLRPSKARGKLFLEEPRRAAGMTEEFISRLREWEEAESSD
ncbi:MAG: ferritin-like domain-containing protein [Fuerstiella sp.]|nr:ferritin-like domain-containing protein [Fuerstiella sp.]